MEQQDEQGGLENGPQDQPFSYAPNGIAYQWDPEVGKWYPYDPKAGHRLAGRPRLKLPTAGPHGVTERGEPKMAPYPSNRKKPKDAKAKYMAAKRRRKKKFVELDAEVKGKERELRETQTKLENAEQLKALLVKSPSVKDQRAAILGLFKTYDFSPVEELIQMVIGGEVEGKDKIAILKALAEFEAPKPKSIDIEGSVKSEMTVNVIDFANTSRKMLKDAEKVIEMEDADYGEFESEVT